MLRFHESHVQQLRANRATVRKMHAIRTAHLPQRRPQRPHDDRLGRIPRWFALRPCLLQCLLIRAVSPTACGSLFAWSISEGRGWLAINAAFLLAALFTVVSLTLSVWVPSRLNRQFGS